MNDIDAITLAIKEEVTRDQRIGQGNGLFSVYFVLQVVRFRFHQEKQ